MSRTFTVTSEQRDEFDRRGVLRLEGLLSADAVRRARELVLGRLAQIGVTQAGGWRLGDGSRPQWPETGLKTSWAIGNKHPEIEALIEEPALLAIVDTLLDGRDFDRTAYKRPQVLFTLPNAQVWTLPTGWHADGPRLASGQGYGVQLFAFLDAGQPGGGGTVVVAGSHRLLNEGRFMRMKEMRRLLGREDFFRTLYSEGSGDAEERGRLLTEACVVGGVPLQVVELTGAPGDAWFVDLRVLHAAAPNAADCPRMMVTHRFVRADLMPEIAEAYGWR